MAQSTVNEKREGGGKSNQVGGITDERTTAERDFFRHHLLLSAIFQAKKTHNFSLPVRMKVCWPSSRWCGSSNLASFKDYPADPLTGAFGAISSMKVKIAE